jgi:hypothetical protein
MKLQGIGVGNLVTTYQPSSAAEARGCKGEYIDGKFVWEFSAAQVGFFLSCFVTVGAARSASLSAARARGAL